ncbi:MAG: glycosyltransferase family 4 protein [Methanomassiliicoccales archaeon]|nr:MAG: glycosyltransferase family 4 protein [Methanomassiliicoccales archaeon]
MLYMKILFLALDINIGNKTGDSIHVRELAVSLAKLGNNVILITADTKNKSSGLNWAKKIPNLHLFFNERRQRFRNISTLIYCRKIAKKYHVQIIYERRPSPKIGFALGRLLRIPFIVEINALVEEEIALVGERREEISVIKHIKKAFRRHFFKQAKRVVTVTRNIGNEIQRTYNLPDEKIGVIPNGANTDLFKPIDLDTCKKRLDLDKDSRYICFTGNLAPWQGVKYMIDAMPLILAEIPDVTLVIVGGGTQKEALEDRSRKLGVDKHVIFAGWVDYEKVPIYINASDICVAPLSTGREKSGSSAIKIYEYLACGKPVIASDVPSLEFLKKSGCGIIVPKDDVPALASASIQLLSNPPHRARLGQTGRKIVTEKYSWVSTAKKVTDLLEYTVKSDNSPLLFFR